MVHPYFRKQRNKMKYSAHMTLARTQGSVGGQTCEGVQGSTSPDHTVVFDPRYARDLSEAHTWIKNGTTQEELDEIERELDRRDWRQL